MPGRSPTSSQDLAVWATVFSVTCDDLSREYTQAKQSKASLKAAYHQLNKCYSDSKRQTEEVCKEALDAAMACKGSTTKCLPLMRALEECVLRKHTGETK